jgi:hypothetical protein
VNQGESASTTEGPTLFHYTTAAGLLGILGASKLWATDLRFLNDSQEGIFAQEFLVEAVRRMDNPVLETGHWAHSLGQRAIETFEQYRGYTIEALQTRFPAVYVCCFCEVGDLLSQWRGYGADHGYAIEVRKDALLETIEGLPAYPPAKGLGPVHYGLESAPKVAARATEDIGRFNLNHPGVKAEYAAINLAAALSTIKHPDFSEEREWRLYAAVESAPHFRATPMSIVPYIEVDLAVDAIVSVRVGPGNSIDVRQAGVRRLLDSIGSTATVLRSDVPLRS